MLNLIHTASIKYEVTASDISLGDHEPSTCPVARALSRAAGGAFVMIGWGYAGIWYGDKDKFGNPVSTKYDLDCKGRIEMWDKKNYMVPFKGEALRV